MSNGPEFISDRSRVDVGNRFVEVQQPVGATVVQQVPVVTAEPVVAQRAQAVRTSYSRRFAPDAAVAAFVGLVITLVGLLAITRGGFDGPMETPVVDVLGFTHTTVLGLIEIVIGGCLLISGATQARSGALFFGSVLGIASFVGAVQTKSFSKNLALESGWAWLMLFAAVVVVLAALTLPRFLTRSTTVEHL